MLDAILTTVEQVGNVTLAGTGAGAASGVAPTLAEKVLPGVGAGSAAGLAPTYTNTFEGGTAGSNISTANSGGSSGWPWDAVSAVAPKYTATSARGALAMLLTSITSGQAQNVEWDNIGALTTDVWFRMYVTIPTLTNESMSIARVSTSAPVASGTLKTVGATNAIAFADAGGTNRAVGSVAMLANTRMRIEGRIKSSTTVGELEWWLYLTEDSTTADDHGVATGLALGANSDRFIVGWTSAGNAPQAAGTWIIDDVALSTAGKIGPSQMSALSITSAVGAGSAAGVVPAISEQVVGAVGSASAAGVAPALAVQAVAAVGAASAAGVAPAPGEGIAGVVGAASAAGVVPVLSGQVIGTVGSASAAGVAPSVGQQVFGAVGAGSATGVTPLRVVPTVRRNSFEGGTNGAALVAGSAGNSGGASGDAFDLVTGPVTPSFTNTGQRDTLGLLLTSAIGGQQQRVAWRNIGQLTSDIWIRGYLRVSAFTSEGCVILRVTDSSINQTAALKITASNKIAAADAAGTNKGSGAVTVGADTARIRFEARIKPSTTAGELEWWLYNTEDSIVESDHNLVTGQVLGADIDGIDWGWVSAGNAPGASAVTWVLDDLAVSFAGKIGPATPIAYPPVASGSAAGVAPVVARQIIGVAGAAAAAGVAPGLAVQVTAPVAAASAAGVVPVIREQPVGVVGAGSAVGIAPALTEQITAAVGAASGTAVGFVGMPYSPFARNNNAEGGTNNATITTANSGGASGDAWDSIGNSPNYSTTNARGLMGVKLISGATGTARWMRWNTLGAALGDVWGRVYVTPEALASTNNVTVMLFTDTAGANVARVRVTPAGLVQITDAGGTARAALTTPMVAGQRVRIEARVNQQTGSLEIWLYQSEDSQTATDHDVATGKVLGSLGVDQLLFGFSGAGTAPDVVTAWEIDEMAVSNIAKIGPAPSTLYPPVGAASAAGVVPAFVGITSVNAPIGLGAASGIAPVLPVYPGTGQGSAAGVAPTLATGFFVNPPVGAASAAGVVPAIQDKINAPAASSGSAAGVVPSLLRSVAPPSGAASAAGVTPVLQHRLSGVVASGSAAGVVPALGRYAPTPPSGVGAVSGLAPALTIRETMVVAQGSAAGVAAVVLQSVTAVRATGSAAGVVPFGFAYGLQVAVVAQGSASGVTPGTVWGVTGVVAVGGAAGVAPTLLVVANPFTVTVRNGRVWAGLLVSRTVAALVSDGRTAAEVVDDGRRHADLVSDGRTDAEVVDSVTVADLVVA